MVAGMGKLLWGLWGLGGWGMGLRMCLQPLGLREQGPSARNPDTQLSKGSQGQGSSGCRCSGGMVAGVGLLPLGL